MFERLPSLRGFQPTFYSGGPTRFYLPLVYDLVAQGKPKRLVVLGFGDGDVFLTCCQATTEQKVDCDCVAVRRDRAAESSEGDSSWQRGRPNAEEFYGDRARFFATPVEALTAIPDGSVDFLWLDDCDSGLEIGKDLGVWQVKLSPQAIVLFHGLDLERDDSPATAWNEWIGNRLHAHYPVGIGLGIAVEKSSELALFTNHSDDLAVIYSIAAGRIDAMALATAAEKTAAAFETRQVWLDSLLTDRRKVQVIMDHQAHRIAFLEQALKEQRYHFDNLRRDRAKAQLVMDTQHEQLKRLAAQSDALREKVESLKTQLKEHKAILSAAKKACRKGGRCFQIQSGEKTRRPLRERIARELRRLPRNLGIGRKAETPPVPQTVETTSRPIDRYESWIAIHEPDAAALEEQRDLSKKFSRRPKISLLTPVHNPPAKFLEQMFTSVAAQTYDNWELCVVDAASERAETLEVLRRWEGCDQRIRLERLAENHGIAENTNRALQMATGDFIACLDHDDILAPFALYEVARALTEFPEADILYSDEDRLSEKGKRHAPFFKPEWDPELLTASMYLGHLTAYRRTLALELNGFRKEFDLSQDYDFALRATERAKSIHHIPHVLYHWREHPESGSTGGKPDARRTNLAALADAMRRRNLPADILEYPTANRARLKIERWPRVSVIVPTDSPTRAQACLEQLPRATKYPDLEVVVVTNSQLAESLKFIEPEDASVRMVEYDKPFNFSDKCNVGAAAATGERLIFFNDDVEAEQEDWIQNLIEPLENPEIGAVAPKLLYETGKIQHAGLVTGVRGLIGTAFHERPADTTEHVNFAQSLRDVSALSAACLAMRRDDFVKIGGFDADNTPIAHSDVDLCFKVREAGLRCVYTPFATLRHAGHVSIGFSEKQSRGGRRQDKATTFLLKRWGAYVTHDPYFPDNMRDWLFLDSPTPIQMHAPQRAASVETSPDLLFVSHDLTLSGAPILLMQLAIWCQRNGMFVTVMSPSDGLLREKYVAAGIPLIVDPLCETGHESFEKFARDFDCVLSNTVRTEGAVRAAHKAGVPVIWWVHETEVGEHYLREEPKLRSALPLADAILAPTERTAAVYRPFTDAVVKSSPYGIPDVGSETDGATTRGPEDPLRFLLLGSVEPRKGQDIFLEAISLLPEAAQKRAQFRILGRVMDPEFGERIRTAAARLANVSLDSETDHAAALNAIRQCDVLVCSSRDEALPVTILEAMSFGKAIVSARVGGVGEVLTEAEDALIVAREDPKGLANAMRRLIDNPDLARRLGNGGRATFETRFTQDRFGRDFRELVAEVMRANR